MDDVTLVTKTFERPAALERLIRSVKRFYPDLPIIVTDDSFTPSPREDVTYIRMPPDAGIGACRNELLARVETPYFLIVDDDVEFTDQTRLESLRLVLDENTDVVLAAGDYVGPRTGARQHWHGTFERIGSELFLQQACHELRRGAIDYSLCDITHYFFMGHTAPIREVGWDEQFKVTGEHLDFMLRLNDAGLRLARVPSVVVNHWQDRPAKFSRWRSRDYRAAVLKKHGLSSVTFFGGDVYRLPTNET